MQGPTHTSPEKGASAAGPVPARSLFPLACLESSLLSTSDEVPAQHDALQCSGEDNGVERREKEEDEEGEEGQDGHRQGRFGPDRVLGTALADQKMLRRALRAHGVQL